MSGPTCEVIFDMEQSLALPAIDAVLSKAEMIRRTRKGRVWDVWFHGRPVHVSVEDSTRAIVLAAGCNSHEDYELLRRLAAELVSVLGGLASEPTK